ncbi:MAG: YhfC family glutamic-type intramembrane protease [Eubacteriales bacterium]
MVSASSIIMMIVIGVGCLIMPIAAILIIRTKSKNITAAFFAGVLSFFIMQGVLRINILKVLSMNEGYLNFAKNNFYIYVLLIAFSAALFETVGRYLTMKLLMKDKVSYYGGIAHGIGHGGIEMILLVSLTYVSNIVIATQINSGVWQQMIETMQASGYTNEATINSLLAAQEALVNTPPKEFLVALVERFFTLFFHIGLSVMVAEGIVKNKALLYSGLVIVIHTLADFVSPVLINAGVNIYIVEGVIGMLAVAMFVYTLGSKKRFEKLSKIYPVEQEQEMLESDY